MSWLSTFDNLGVNLRNLFRPKNTEPLPWKATRERSSRYRASFALVHNEHGEEACIGCKMCEKICPSEIITVVPGGRHESPATGKKRGRARTSSWTSTPASYASCASRYVLRTRS